MPEPATLVIGPSWIGDMVMAQSLLLLLKQRQPGLAIDMLAPAWSLSVVERMPEVRRAIATGVGHGELGLGKCRALGQEFRGHYDRAIVLPRSIKSALVPWFANIETRTGFRGESRYLLINDMRPLDPGVLDQTVKRFVALGLERDEPLPETPFPALVVSAENQRAIMKTLDVETERPVVALMPGAEYGPSKCWPLAEFAALAGQLADDGFEVWILGSTRDDAAAQRIAATGSARSLCGKTSLADVIDLLGYAEHAVSNDSGLMHIAAAVGAYTHVMYGSSSPTLTPPLTNKHHVHWLQLECSPCMERQCPLGHHRCLTEISAADVYANIVRAPAAS